MKLSEFLEMLSHGEMRSTAIGGSQASGFQERDYPRIVPLVNLGLYELHKRFLIKTESLPIQQYDNISSYILHPDYAQTNTSSTKTKYILDTVFKPFTSADVILKIEAVVDEKGVEYFLNDSKQPHSLFTPTYNTVQVPFPEASNIMEVQYRTNHAKLVSTGDDVQNQEVDISPVYLEALLAFVANRYFAGSGTAIGLQEAGLYFQKFEAACQKITELNLATRDQMTNTKLDDNGWV